MKVILTQDIDNLGKARDIVEVKAGYANNYLIKKGLALQATSGNMDTLNEELARLSAENKKAKDDATAIANELNGKTFKIVQPGGPDGKLYGAVTPKDVAAVIEQELSLIVDKRKIPMDPIKQADTYEIKVKLHPEVEADIYVVVANKE